MCGIFGMISKKEKPFNKRAFCTMGVDNDSRGGDSCGIFIDGLVEYGVDKQKEFIDFFRDSLILKTATECKVALGHCRKASVGKVSVETAQPVVLYNKQGQVDFVLIHNGTIYNYKELANKYIPDINIDGLTDSQVMARIFYHAGYDALDEYQGGSVFVIHDYRTNKSLVFKGASKKYLYAKEAEEERPLYYCWHNGRFVFSSIFETLYAFYYEETVYTLSPNKLKVIKGDKLKLVKEYSRENVLQTKPVITTPTVANPIYAAGYYDDWDYPMYDTYRTNNESFSYSIQHNGLTYLDDKKEPLHGVYYISSYGYVFPNKKNNETWLQEVGFFMGRMLKHPKAFPLINKEYIACNKVLTPRLKTLINILDFNPYSDDEVQYYWYCETSKTIPQGEWKWPMIPFSCIFDNTGVIVDLNKNTYGSGWVTDYKMYTYEEEKILKLWKKLCGGV